MRMGKLDLLQWRVCIFHHVKIGVLNIISCIVHTHFIRHYYLSLGMKGRNYIPTFNFFLCFFCERVNPIFAFWARLAPSPRSPCRPTTPPQRLFSTTHYNIKGIALLALARPIVASSKATSEQHVVIIAYRWTPRLATSSCRLRRNYTYLARDHIFLLEK